MSDSPFDEFESREIGRRRPARQPLFSSEDQPEVIFVTVGTKEKKRILASEDVHQLLIEKWKEAHEWAVGRYVIMPDHIHLFCAPAVQQPVNVKDWVAFWKSRAASVWPRPEESPIWLPNCWDTQLRKGESYRAKWEYVKENPVRHGLVKESDAWPFQGELHSLIWRDR